MAIVRPISDQPLPKHAKKVIFEKLKRPDTVIVFPVLENGNILLTHQEQPGSAIFTSAPGGRVDEGEDVLAAAKRELLEEAGYAASEWTLWDSRQPVLKIDWAVYTFIAKGLKKVVDVSLDGGEKIQVQEYSFEELLDIAEDEKFDAKEVVPQLLKAKIYPEKRAELEKLFQPL